MPKLRNIDLDTDLTNLTIFEKIPASKTGRKAEKKKMPVKLRREAKQRHQDYFLDSHGR